MKGLIALFASALAMTFVFAGVSTNVTSKTIIKQIYNNNQAQFAMSVDNGEFEKLVNIDGVQSVFESEDYVDINCGNVGGKAYYGIFYSADGDMCAVDVAAPVELMDSCGDGFKYENLNGQKYYVESLGDNFFYYEAEFK